MLYGGRRRLNPSPPFIRTCEQRTCPDLSRLPKQIPLARDATRRWPRQRPDRGPLPPRPAPRAPREDGGRTRSAAPGALGFLVTYVRSVEQPATPRTLASNSVQRDCRFWVSLSIWSCKTLIERPTGLQCKRQRSRPRWRNEDGLLAWPSARAATWPPAGDLVLET